MWTFLEFINWIYEFQKNIEIQKKLNESRSHNSSATYGITKFSDLSDAEFRGG